MTTIKNITQVKKKNTVCTPIFMRFTQVVKHSCSLLSFVTMWYSSICIRPNLSILLLMNTGLFAVLSMSVVHVFGHVNV